MNAKSFNQGNLLFNYAIEENTISLLGTVQKYQLVLRILELSI